MKILKFEELFDRQFGQGGNLKHNFGTHKSVLNPNNICIELPTPNHIVFDASFDGTDSVSLTSDRMIVVADHPWAMPEDDGVIGIQDISSDAQVPRLSLFVNSVLVDPHPPKVSDGTRPEARPNPRTTGLLNGRLYYLHYYRTKLRHDMMHPPMPLLYQCRDKKDKQTPLHAPKSKRVMIDGLMGTWTPHKHGPGDHS